MLVPNWIQITKKWSKKLRWLNIFMSILRISCLFIYWMSQFYVAPCIYINLYIIIELKIAYENVFIYQTFQENWQTLLYIYNWQYIFVGQLTSIWKEELNRKTMDHKSIAKSDCQQNNQSHSKSLLHSR